jgi:hypothetical protein
MSRVVEKGTAYVEKVCFMGGRGSLGEPPAGAAACLWGRSVLVGRAVWR